MQKPHIIVKIASSLDGKIATRHGESQWITNQESRSYGHRMRANVDMIAIGSETLLKDNPLLTCRLPEFHQKQPDIAVFDGRFRVSETAKLFTVTERRIFIFTKRVCDKNKAQRLQERGIEIFEIGVDSDEDKLSFSQAIQILVEKGIQKILLEGGGQIIASALKSGLVNEIYWFRAPIILGGDARSAIGDCNLKTLTDVFKLKNIEYRKILGDLFERYELES